MFDCASGLMAARDQRESAIARALRRELRTSTHTVQSAPPDGKREQPTQQGSRAHLEGDDGEAGVHVAVLVDVVLVRVELRPGRPVEHVLRPDTPDGPPGQSSRAGVDGGGVGWH